MRVLVVDQPDSGTAPELDTLAALPGIELIPHRCASLYAFALISALDPDVVVVNTLAGTPFGSDVGRLHDHPVSVPVVVLVGDRDRVRRWRPLFHAGTLHELALDAGLGASLFRILTPGTAPADAPSQPRRAAGAARAPAPAARSRGPNTGLGPSGASRAQ
jgi:hypothetical protein